MHRPHGHEPAGDQAQRHCGAGATTTQLGARAGQQCVALPASRWALSPPDQRSVNGPAGARRQTLTRLYFIVQGYLGLGPAGPALASPGQALPVMFLII